MSIKEWGGGGVIVIGGVIYGISQYGLNDVLSEDLRHISDVSYEERAAYMESVVSEFAENFAAYTVQTETYVYAGLSEFSSIPAVGAFVEVVRAESPVPSKEVSGVSAAMVEMNFCEQDEMTMFTENGWSYRFSMKDSNEHNIFNVICSPGDLRVSATS